MNYTKFVLMGFLVTSSIMPMYSLHSFMRLPTRAQCNRRAMAVRLYATKPSADSVPSLYYPERIRLAVSMKECNEQKLKSLREKLKSDGLVCSDASSGVYAKGDERCGCGFFSRCRIKNGDEKMNKAIRAYQEIEAQTAIRDQWNSEIEHLQERYECLSRGQQGDHRASNPGSLIVTAHTMGMVMGDNNPLKAIDIIGQVSGKYNSK